MHTTVSLLAVLLLAVSWPQPAAADTGIDVIFSDGEIATIRAWYRDHSGRESGSKRGKDRGSLPPGIAKNLQRGKPLPPGIAMQVLPPDLVAQLPPAPKGYDRIVVSGKVLLVEIATRIIHDVLEDVFLD